MTPVFIHSLFRTGSTYIWSKLRSDQNICAYYEPFNEILNHLTYNISSTYDEYKGINQLGHSPFGNRYFFEYEKLLQVNTPGVPGFVKSFTTEDFCKVSDNEKLLNYMNILIRHAGNKRPVFQFNRSSLRVDWFSDHFSNALNIYLVRNPRDNWSSYIENSKKNNNYFLAMNLMIASQSKFDKQFHELHKRIDLFKYISNTFDNDCKSYTRIITAYSLEEHYFIFYYIWLISFLKNTYYSDHIININKLTDNIEYINETSEFINKIGVNNINFQDANIKCYSNHSISKTRMGEIEKCVHKIFLNSRNDSLNLRFKKIFLDEIEYFGIQFGKSERTDDTSFSYTKNDTIRYNKILTELLNDNYLLIQDFDGCNQKLQSIYSSTYWRIFSQLRVFIRFFKKIFSFLN